ncbi:hypothetical protein MTO96_035822 [Rhipicephalus appendiculatus]
MTSMATDHNEVKNSTLIMDDVGFGTSDLQLTTRQGTFSKSLDTRGHHRKPNYVERKRNRARDAQHDIADDGATSRKAAGYAAWHIERQRSAADHYNAGPYGNAPDVLAN